MVAKSLIIKLLMKSISEILSELPEWSDDWKAHALFCAYDEDNSEEFVVEFWKRAIFKILDEHVSGISIECNELRTFAQRKGRTPIGLQEIIKELINRGDLISVEQINEQTESKISSQAWGSWIGKKLKNIWSSPVETSRITSLSKLNELSEKLIKFARDRNRNTYMIDEILNYTEISQSELKILLNFMFLQENAIIFREQMEGSSADMIKLKLAIDEELKVMPEDTAIVTLNLTISEIDKRIDDLNKTKDFLHAQVISQIKAQNKLNAKHFLQRRKMVEQKIDNLLGSRLNIEEQLLNISNSLTNKTIINSIKTTNQALKNIAPNLSEITKLVDISKEYIDTQQEISSILSENNQEINDADILEEFEKLSDLEIPSVPTYPIKLQSAADLQEFDEVITEKTQVILNS